MADDYLWDRSGAPDPDTEQLETLLAPLAHDAPLDDMRLVRTRRGEPEPARATAHEPVAAPPPRGRTKGTMSFFHQHSIGIASFAAAIALVGITAYERHVDAVDARTAPAPQTAHDNHIAFLRSLAQTTTPAPPIAPATGADVAITVGENAAIHVPFGAVDVEIQSPCRADIELWVVHAAGMIQRTPGAPEEQLVMPDLDFVVESTARADGRASTYHLSPGPSFDTFEYAARCADARAATGVIVLDRDDAEGTIGPLTNARVFHNQEALTPDDPAIHVFGSVLPGARVSVGGAPVALVPAAPQTARDPQLGMGFAVDVPVTREHPVAAVRVADASGTQFYVIRPAVVMSVHTVPPTMLEGSRISGEKEIAPDDPTRDEMRTSGKDRVVGSFKLCLAADGSISNVAMIKSTGFPAYDSKIQTKIHDEWRYRPYVVAGEAVPVCTAVTFIYRQSK